MGDAWFKAGACLVEISDSRVSCTHILTKGILSGFCRQTITLDILELDREGIANHFEGVKRRFWWVYYCGLELFEWFSIMSTLFLLCLTKDVILEYMYY